MKTSRFAAVLVASLAPIACNDLTGVNDLVIAESGGSDGSGGAAGDPTGGAGAGNPAGPSGSVASSSSSGAPGPGASSSAASSSSSSSGGSCDYPVGPTGTSQGQIVPSQFNWQGYKKNQNSISSVSIEDYFDCDGSKGVNAVLFLQSATWCGACQDEASQIDGLAAGWAGMGIEVVTLMIEDINSQPATTATALQWKNAFGLTSVAVLADPNFSFAHAGSNGLPMSIVVNPRTMKIVYMEEGYSGDYSALVQLAQQNQ